MAGQHDLRQPDKMEDQFRRMILANGSTATENVGPQARPTVRLPPSAPHQYSQQHQSSVLPAQMTPTNPNGHGNPRPTPLPQTGNLLPTAQSAQAQDYGGKYGPHQRQNQRDRREQFQKPYGPSAGVGGPQPSNYAPRQQAQPRQVQLDPNAFQRGGRTAGYYQPQGPAARQLFNPNARGPSPNALPDYHRKQIEYLAQVVAAELPRVDMKQAERDEKEAFRAKLQGVIQEVCGTDPKRLPIVSLECFGSFKSGFASADSDMDLVIVLRDGTPYSACFSLLEDDLPRLLEKRLLQLGYGARLLSRTRVPIIKICERPDDCLLDKLRAERESWDVLEPENKYPHLYPEAEAEEATAEAVEAVEITEAESSSGPNTTALAAVPAANNAQGALNTTTQSTSKPAINGNNRHPSQNGKKPEPSTGVDGPPEKPRHAPKVWTRERKAGPLDFPKTGAGIQCDINFFNPLGLHNTQLLRCYSLCDDRVRPMILFVKAWAKQRKINSSYSGTLSSYGYVLMVLHYLTNIAQPPVLTNLQLPWRPNAQCTPHGATRTEVDEWTVDFWRNEDEITKAVQARQMTTNREPLGSLLAGFFNYYASQGGPPQFHWMHEILSLRSPGGILSKQEKGWVKATTEEGGGKKVQHRYLFCIEDPFELSHNVARTVTHGGIVAIRDEFRRTNRILHAIGVGQLPRDGELFAQLVEAEDFEKATAGLRLDGAAAGIPIAVHQGSSNDAEDAKAKNQKNQERFAQSRKNSANGHVQRPAASFAPPAGPTKTPFDTKDAGAFPALGGAKQQKKKDVQKSFVDSSDTSEISGDRARVYLEELSRKKADRHAEMTARRAAEAVLGDD
ncbi:hypothetical protein LTR08_008730 [Meristemomyces frigidus]|nr:hypothetical protein LTR08_008730 [Meristemomyces frigidus]